MWEIRKYEEEFDPDTTYTDFPNMFSIELHHGGKFRMFPNIEYIEGLMSYIDMVDIDEFSVLEMDAIMVQLGYEVPPAIYYNFQLPNEGFVDGLRTLSNDTDIHNLSKYVGDNKLIKVYTEHGQTHLLEPDNEDHIEPIEEHVAIGFGKEMMQHIEEFDPFFGSEYNDNISIISEHIQEGVDGSNGLSKYEVQGPWFDQHVVDMVQMTCTCRKWELIGIPCRHAIAAINEISDNGETVGELYTYVHKVYWLDTWKKMYSFKVGPIKGRAMWPKSECPTTLTPPPHQKQAGRPKKKRRQSEEERRDSQRKSQSQRHSQGQGESHKLTRKYVSVTCGKCNNKGHNARTCKGQGGN